MRNVAIFTVIFYWITLNKYASALPTPSLQLRLQKTDFMALDSSKSKFYGYYDNYRKHFIRQYEMKDVVKCLDSMFINRNRSIHLAFMGDSLVRNQFLNFISVCIIGSSNSIFLKSNYHHSYW